MRLRLLPSALALVLALGAFPIEGRAQLLITEFQAINDSTLSDRDREFSDWLEIFNSGDAAVDLEGYILTDDANDLQKWTFPSLVLDSKQSLVVFASGKDLRDPAGELHTNFSLTGRGEPLFLLEPGGVNVAHGFPPQFPPQVADVSYGIATSSEFFTLIEGDSPVRAFVPTDDSLGVAWREPGFDDSSWLQGPGGVGLEENTGYEPFIGVDVLAEMLDQNASIYIRIPFNVESPERFDTLTLGVRYDDGFAAFLNGEMIASANAEDGLAWNASASSSHSDRLAVEYESFDITAFSDRLVPGENVLAIHGLNFSTGSGDFLIQAELRAVEIGEVTPDVLLYFPTPTPGAPNGPGVPLIAPEAEFSHEGGGFSEPQDVELTTTLEGAEIRYTTDGSTPDASSTLYAGPIRVDTTVELRARVFADGYLGSPTATRFFMIIAPALQSFSSSIPIAIVNTFGRTIPSTCDGIYTPGHITLIEPGEDGRARITDQPSFAHTAAYRRRGSSTCGRSKFSFNVEFRDDEGQEANLPILGWPRHADYSMYGPYNFDRALIRNALMYELSRQAGRYAPRVRMVEVFLHEGARSRQVLSNSSYWGVYVFMERNKRGTGRIDVEKLGAGDNEEPEVSGGYVMKVDRAGGGTTSISGGGQSMVMVHPKTPTAQQRAWLTNFLNQMRTRIDPERVFDAPEFVDVGAWLDHHILNVYPKNVDAFRLSGYMFKDRGGPLQMGPIWDFDRTMGCADDGRAADPFSWANSGGDGGTQYFAFGWFGPLFRNQPPLADSAWNRAYRARWRELRNGPLATENVLAVIDAFAAELNEGGNDSPAARNQARWREVTGRFGGFNGEINHLKNWMRDRGDWMDNQFVEPPSLVHAGEVIRDDQVQIEPGYILEITSSSDQAEIWYTLDGSDPREGTRPSASATRYTSPITIQENVRVRARSLEGTLWSSDVASTFVTTFPRLTITELMYNPLPPTLEEDPANEFSATNLEFLEIQNVGDETVRLTQGFRLTRGAIFDFGGSAIDLLAPGEVVLLVHNQAAMEARYGMGLPIAGEYTGSLSNSGEVVELEGPLGVRIVEFSYDDDWYPSTDGEGFSLENTDPVNHRDLGVAESWRASTALHGSPGVAGELPPQGGPRLPGDLDGNGRLSINDASTLLRFLFLGLDVEIGCELAGADRLRDVDGNGTSGINDAVMLLNFLFRAGPAPALGRACVPVSACEDRCVQP